MKRGCLVVLLGLFVWIVSLPGSGHAGETTVFGILRQASDGGIVLENPQNPQVVYIPFDKNAIMDSMLNVQVQVTGEIRDSFVRDGKTYSIIAASNIKILEAEYGNTKITKQANYGLPGTDTAEIHAYFNKTCYLYAHYAIIERSSDDTDGHSLRVLRREPQDDSAAICEAREGTPLFKIPNGGDFSFAGLAGDVLFIQNGPVSGLHGLMAVNLASQQQILNAVVVPGATVVGHSLHYPGLAENTSGHRALCPQGKTAVRMMDLDCTTGHIHTDGKTSCWPK